MFLLTFFLTCSATCNPCGTQSSCPASCAVENTTRREITDAQLKSWYDEKKEMFVLDARTKPYFDGTLLPNAKWVPADASDEVINTAVPSKEATIVVYCHGKDCPASGMLYDKLSKMGYTQVYEYHDGLVGWQGKGYDTSKV